MITIYSISLYSVLSNQFQISETEVSEMNQWLSSYGAKTSSTKATIAKKLLKQRGVKYLYLLVRTSDCEINMCWDVSTNTLCCTRYLFRFRIFIKSIEKSYRKPFIFWTSDKHVSHHKNTIFPTFCSDRPVGGQIVRHWFPRCQCAAKYSFCSYWDGVHVLSLQWLAICSLSSVASFAKRFWQ